MILSTSQFLRRFMSGLFVVLSMATLQAAPVIQIQPVSQTVNEGEAVTFTVVATGSGTLSYQWHKDGVDIPGATSSSFSLMKAKPWHIGNYTITVSDDSSLLVSSIATLDINNKIKSIWQGLLYYWPMDGSADDKGFIKNSFVVKNAIPSVDKNGNFDSCYYFNGVNASMVTKNESLISGSSPRSISFWFKHENLSFYLGKPTMIGQGVKQNSQMFGLISDPQSGRNYMSLWGDWIGTNFGNGWLKAGVWSHAVLTLSAPGSTVAAKLYIDGQEVSVASATVGGAYNTSPTKIRISTISDDGYINNDGYIWWNQGFKGWIDNVRVYNRDLTASEVNVLYESEKTALAPEISVQQLQGVTIDDGGFYDFGQVGTSNGTATISFTIKNTGTMNLTGLITNISGADQAKFILLSLPTGPLEPGDSTTFSVQVAGLTNGLKTAVLRIASNDLDEASYDIILFATGVAANLPSVTTSAASSISLDRAFLNGSVKANNLERAVFFDYGPTTSYGSTVAAEPATVSGNVSTNVSASIADLLPHTKYNFRVRAVSSLGTATGANVTFTTRNRVPVAQDDEILALPSAKVVISPLINDSDDDGDVLTIAQDFTQPGNTVGRVTKMGSDLVFTPAAGFKGGSFKYSAVDAFGGKATATIKLILDDVSMGEDAIIPSNSEPYDLWVSANAPWNASESIAWLNIEPFIESGYVHVIPARNSSSKSRTEVILIGGKPHTVTQAGNGAPVAEDDEILALPSAKIIINPLINDSDPDSDVLSIATDFTQPGKEVGTLVKVGTDLIFTPTAGFTGGTFTYSAIDVFGGKSNKATVKLILAECSLGENVTIAADSPPYNLTVTATAPWNAIESIPWLSVEAPTSNATQLRLIPQGNPSKESRTGTVIIGGKTHTVTQTGIRLSPVITTPVVIPIAVIGSNYDLAIPTSNGPVSYTVFGMPKGLVLSNINGRISGVPTVTGDFTLTVFAENGIGRSNPISFDIKVLPFLKALAGNYSATIADSALITDKLGGLMTMTVTNAGGVTGTLKIGTGTYPFVGRLNITVNPLNQDYSQTVFQTIIARKGNPSVLLTVIWNSTEYIFGNVDLLGNESDSSALTGSKHIGITEYNIYEGAYTVALSDNSGLVQGDGFLTFTVSRTGAVVWSGQLADGARIPPKSATLWVNGQLPLFVLLYGNKGSLNQLIEIDLRYNYYSFDWDKKVLGSPHWIKKPQIVTTRAYADGFETTLSASGAAFSASMLREWPYNYLNLVRVGFQGGDIEAVSQYEGLARDFIISRSGAAIVARQNPVQFEPRIPENMQISFDTARGTFTGSMSLRDPNPFDERLPWITRPVKFNGVLNAATGKATGYFLLPSITGPPANTTKSPVTSGRVIVEPNGS